MPPSSIELCEDLLRLVRSIKVSLVRIGEEYDLTPPQLSALYAIHNGDVKMGSVAHALHCDASNATGIIDRLENQKLVVRQESKQDRRVKTLRLTPQGEEVVTKVMAQLPHALGCNQLTKQECLQFHNMVRKLHII